MATTTNSSQPVQARKKTTARRTSAKQTNEAAAAQAAELAELQAKLAAAMKTIADHEARDNGTDAPAQATKDAITTLYRPSGEAGSLKKGFNLQDAMGLEDDRDTYKAIQRLVHRNARRVGLDASVDFARQDPGKLAMVYKVARNMPGAYLTQERFPLDWAQADLVKQYMRNVRKHEVKNKRMPKRAERKRKQLENQDGPSRAPVAIGQGSDVEGTD
uniref:Tail assembly chaperone n=1 Tax=Mycena chlorophos TaxID=658473 RepID=A0ABQ0LD24_MYCCL|nr:predicted protein [Mycena chlorophos]